MLVTGLSACWAWERTFVNDIFLFCFIIVKVVVIVEFGIYMNI